MSVRARWSTLTTINRRKKKQEIKCIKHNTMDGWRWGDGWTAGVHRTDDDSIASVAVCEWLLAVVWWSWMVTVWPPVVAQTQPCTNTGPVATMPIFSKPTHITRHTNFNVWTCRDFRIEKRQLHLRANVAAVVHIHFFLPTRRLAFERERYDCTETAKMESDPNKRDRNKWFFFFCLFCDDDNDFELKVDGWNVSSNKWQ